MIYLGNLSYLDTIKKIVRKHPPLLYLICYIGNPENFTLDSRILFNIEVECNELEKFNIIKFRSSSNRPTHNVTQTTLSRYGKKIFSELKNHEICRKMVELLNFESAEEFSLSFNQNFSVEVNPNDEIKRKINEIKQTFPIPDNHYEWNKEGNHLFIEYMNINNEISVEIKLRCLCLNLIIKHITLDSLKENLETKFSEFQMDCDDCLKEFYISADLRRFRYVT